MNPGPPSTEVEDLWKSCLRIIEGKVNSQSFQTWFSSVSVQEIEKDTLILTVPNKFFENWLSDHYGDLINQALQETFRRKMSIRFSFQDIQENENLTSNPPAPILHDPSKRELSYSLSSLNPQYSFHNFVVGSSNQFAHAASLAVAEQPSKAYNPLFVYGGVGLGKTHLMHAIGNFIYSRNPGLKMNYISSEKFVNELINGLRHDKMMEFRNRYRSVDVLLVDDIQFIAGKDSTQQEFFHTFNTLYESRKQIVISSDRFPKDIPTLEERLRSRFEWGLIADIQPPDLETKVAILNRKSEERGINIPQEVSLYISSRIKSNIRELEGALIRISAFSSLTGSPITAGLAEEVLKEMFRDEHKLIDITAIQKAVADYYSLSLSDLRSQRRNKSIALPRQVAMYLCRKLTKSSLPEIGRQFGGKDHTTVIHSCKKIEASLKKEDPDLGKAVENISRSLKGS